jgi:hypothetical protein
MAKKKSREPRGQKPPPRCKAILLCEQAIIEAGTGNVSVIGIFDRFVVPEIPGRTRAFTVYLHLTDGIGRYDVVVEVHDLQEDKVIGRADGIALRFPERLHRQNVIVLVPPLSIHHPGRYDVVVFVDGQEIDRQQFRADEASDME